MLSVFSIPKAFVGHIGVIQTNALQSWTLLRPRCEVILFGNDQGVAEAAAEFGAQHVPEVPLNDRGVPQLGWAFRRAREISTQPFLCYVNADVILLDDLLDATSRIGFSEFLLAGQRWDIRPDTPLDTSEGWQDRLVAYAHETGSVHPPAGSDYFVFPTHLDLGLPPFAVGRAGWDNWMLYTARARKMPLIDGTRAVTVMHQEHDYSHHSEVVGNQWVGEETDANRRLGGDPRRTQFLLEDATWSIGRTGGPVRSRRHLTRIAHTGPVLHPWLRPLSILPPLTARVRRLLSAAARRKARP